VPWADGVMNYSTLFITIKGFLENDFPDVIFADKDASSSTAAATFTSAEQINTFITQAEQRIFNTVQFPSLRKNVTGTTSTNNKYLSCPSDFLAVYSMAAINTDGSYAFMLNKDVNFIREAYPIPTSTGVPAYYALFGPNSNDEAELSFILGPTPNAVYSIELHYFYYPESITTTASGTTWLGDNLDSVLLYGAMVEGYTFMKGEPDIISFYDKKYQDALGLAKRLGDGLERQDAYRSGQARVPVR
jgi:hypothetical protein